MPSLFFTGDHEDLVNVNWTTQTFEAATLGGLPTALAYEKGVGSIHMEVYNLTWTPEHPLVGGTRKAFGLDNLPPKFEMGRHYRPQLGLYTVAWFKYFAGGEKFGIDWKALVTGDSSDSLCGGGDGEMVACKLVGMADADKYVKP